MTEKELAMRVGTLVLQVWQMDCALVDLQTQLAQLKPQDPQPPKQE